VNASESAPEPVNDTEGPAEGEANDESTAQVSGDTETDGVREDMVEELLRGFHENSGNAAVGDFIGVEFHKDRPTDAERAEAYRRYVDDLAKRGASELEDGEQ
jgi:hypothetical protein